MLRRLLKEPLLHFLVIGLAFFLIYGYVSSDQGSGAINRIEVDRERLLGFMQYRYKNAQGFRVEDLLDELPEERLQALIEDYIREEALYREAKALNLDKNDYVSRKRLVRQLGFINQGLISTTISLTESDLQAFLDRHKDRYFVPPKTTFTHVFFNREKHGDKKAHRLALAELKVLNRTNVPFHGALSRGDRFLYHRNYVNKAADEIASHFGPDMQKQVFAVGADDRRWQGPFRSPYGVHLVMVTKRTAGHHPPLGDVRQRVEQDATQARLKAELDRISQSIVEGYEVAVADGIQQDPSASTGP